MNFIQIMQIDKKNNCQYIDEYKILKTLGSGYSAQVKLALDLQGKQVAIKQYKHQTSTLQTLKDELKVMQQLNHQNIIKLIAVKENAINKKSNNSNGEKCFAIILEYAAGGQLFDFVAETGKFTQKVARSYFHQMMNGLHYMHDKGYAHRDIKPQNLLLVSNFKLKLADFGFSCLLKGHDGTGVLRTKLGTEGYMAPQIATKNYDGRKTDIFAAGIILFIMYAGTPPFQKATPTDPYFKLIKQKRYDVFWNAHSRKRSSTYFNQHFRDLVQKMIAYTPNQRPTVVQISKHAWTKGVVCSQEEIQEEFKERKKKLDLILQKKRNQKEYQKHRRNENIHTQGGNSRSGQEQDKQFMEIYNKQKLRVQCRKGLLYSSADDIFVDNQHSFVVSQLRYFMKNHRLQLQIDEDSEEIINQVQELKCIDIKDVENHIQVRYLYEFKIDETPFQSEVNVGVYWDVTEDKKTRLHFKLEDGNSFYLKRIVKDIKVNCFP